MDSGSRSIVDSMSSALTGTEKSVDSHLETTMQLSNMHNLVTTNLNNLFCSYKEDMAIVKDVTGTVSYGHFAIGGQTFYLLVAKSGMGLAVNSDDVAIFCGDTMDKLGEALQQANVVDKNFAQWIHDNMRGWRWRHIIAAWP